MTYRTRQKPEKWQKSRRYANPSITNADVYASDSRWHNYVTHNQDSQPGKIEETTGEARLRKEILPEFQLQSKIESDHMAHIRTQPSYRVRREANRPQS